MVTARIWIVGCVWLLLASSGCKHRVVLYCDDDTPCESSARPFCDIDGDFPASEGIGNTCIPDPFVDAGPTGGVDGAVELACASGETAKCLNDELFTCDGEGNVVDSEPCPLGCHEGDPRCNLLNPSNGLAAQLDEAAAGSDLALSDGATINTTTGEIKDGDGSSVQVPTDLIPAPKGGVEIRVLKVKSLTTGDVEVQGDPALAIVSSGDVEITGLLTVGSAGRFEGDGPCFGASLESDVTPWAGAGGGGFGQPGGDGGDAAQSGRAGGAAVGNSSLVPLRGGCRGGSVTTACTGNGCTFSGAVGGLGGGAVQVISGTVILIGTQEATGAIEASGLGAYHAQFSPAGAGGGSGGGILLEAPRVSIASASGLSANGGSGSCEAQEGESGTFGETPAPGGHCSGVSGDGGNGGAGNSAAAPGESATSDGLGGGGGGGVGRIRINTRSGDVEVDSDVVLSPEPSVGTVGTR